MIYLYNGRGVTDYVVVTVLGLVELPPPEIRGKQGVVLGHLHEILTKFWKILSSVQRNYLYVNL